MSAFVAFMLTSHTAVQGVQHRHRRIALVWALFSRFHRFISVVGGILRPFGPHFSSWFCISWAIADKQSNVSGEAQLRHFVRTQSLKKSTFEPTEASAIRLQG